MGHKGVSKRKPKKTNSASNVNNNPGSSSARRGESPASVQSLVNSGEAHLNRGGASPAAGSTKKNRKGK